MPTPKTSSAVTRRVLGRELRVGDRLRGLADDPSTESRVTHLRAYRVPACVLIASVAQEHPDGLPGYLVDTMPTCRGFTAFADDYYEVYRDE